MVFDFGGVFTQSPFEAVRLHGDELGADPEVVLAVLFGDYDQDTDHPWHRLERGEITLTDARTEINELAAARGLEFDPFGAFAKFGTGGHMADAMVERTRRLRSDGVRTALVTNNVREFGDGWRSLDPRRRPVRRGDRLESRGRAQARPEDLPARARRARRHARAVTVPRRLPRQRRRGASALGMRGILVGSDRLAAIAELDHSSAGD